jgi:hypothetical protein
MVMHDVTIPVTPATPNASPAASIGELWGAIKGEKKRKQKSNLGSSKASWINEGKVP